MGSLLGVMLSVSLAGCASTNSDGEEAGDSSGPVSQEKLDQLDAAYDTDYVDTLSLPTVAAPVVTGASPQVSAPIGRNTQDQITPPKGANVQSNLGFFPSLTISVSKRTNPGRVNGADDEDDLSWTIVPVLKYRGAIRNRHIYELSASAATESFDELENLDSENINLGAALRLDMTDKLKVDLFGSLAENSDPRGSTSTRIISPDLENDEYEETSVGARVTIGRRSNPIQVVLGVQQSELDFTNNSQDQRDRQDDRINAGLYFNISPRTSLFVAGSQTDIDYEQGVSRSFDSTNTSVNIGVGWEPTYTTSLLLQAGQAEKEYEQSGFDDVEIDDYLAKLSWLPTDHTNVNLYASRTFEESTVLGSPVTISDIIGLNLGHAFTDAIRAQFYINWIDDELVSARQDDLTDYGIGLFYDFNRYLSLGASWSRTERESTDPDAEYSSETISVSATIKPKRANDFGEPEIQTSEGLRSAE